MAEHLEQQMVRRARRFHRVRKIRFMRSMPLMPARLAQCRCRGISALQISSPSVRMLRAGGVCSSCVLMVACRYGFNLHRAERVAQPAQVVVGAGLLLADRLACERGQLDHLVQVLVQQFAQLLRADLLAQVGGEGVGEHVDNSLGCVLSDANENI